MNRNFTNFLCVASLALAFGWAAFSSTSAYGVSVYWTNTGASNWTVGSNWTPSAPVAADIAYVGRGGTAQVNSLVNNVGNIYIGHNTAPNNGDGTVEISAGADITVLGNVYAKLDNGRNGTINQTGGAIKIGGTLFFDNAGGAGTGTYNLGGGSLNFTHATPASRIISMDREAVFNFTSGSIVGSPIVNVGSAAGNFKSIFNLGGNTLNATQVGIEQNGAGNVADEFNFQGGTVNTSAYFLVGGSTAPGGTIINLGGTDKLTTGSVLYVGYTANNTATFNHNGTVNSLLNVGSSLQLSDGTGTGRDYFNQNSGTLNFTNATPGNRILNIVNEGTFDYFGGTITGSPIVNVGTAAGNFKSIFNLHGNTLNVTQVGIEQNGAGNVADEFNFQGGTVNASAYFLVGGSTAVGGTVINLGGSEKLTTGGPLYVGYTANNMATFNHNGTINSLLNVGNTLQLSDGTGTGRDFFNQNSGALNFTGATKAINIVNEGTFNFVGGTITGTPNVAVGSGGGNISSVFNLGGNTLTAGTIDIDRSAGVKNVADEFNFQGGTVNTTSHFLIGGSNGVGGTVVNLGANEKLNVGTILYVGYTDANDQMATFNHNGSGSSQLNIGSELWIAQGTGALRDYFNQNTGTLNFAGGTKNLDIINDGTFNFVGGSITGTPNVRVGVGSGNFKSIFNLQGKTLSAGNIDVDRTAGVKNAADEFNFQGGTVATTGHFLLGGSNVPGGTIVSLNSGETLTVGTHLYVGYIVGQQGTFEVNGGQLNIASNLRLTELGGTADNAFKLNSGNVNFTGGLASEVNLYGNGKLGVYGGTMSGISNMNVGTQSAGLAVYEQSAGTTSINGQVVVSYNGTTTGQFDMSGGTFTMNNPAEFYLWRTSSANISGTATLNLSRDLMLGMIANANADFNQSGGTVNVARNVVVAANAVSGMTASYDLSGGTLNLTGATSDFRMERNATMNVTGGVANIARNMEVGTISGANAVVNQSSGVVNVANTLSLATVAGANGTYNLTGGGLKVGTLDLTNAGNDAFNLNGGKLSAVLVDNANNLFNYTSGLLSPGLLNSYSTMTFNTGLVMPAAGGIEFDLSTPFVFGGGVNDLLVVNGNLTLDGILSIENVGAGDYPLITFTGTLTDLGLTVPSPLSQSIYIVLNQGGGGTVWLNIIPAPEPSSFLLLGLGMLALKGRRRAVKVAA